jgi:hypothetical protein
MTNQASEDELDTVLKQHREWMRGIRTDHLIGTNHAETKSAIQAIICTEKLKLLAEVREQKKTYLTELAWKNAATEDAVPIEVLTKLEAEI